MVSVLAESTVVLLSRIPIYEQNSLVIFKGVEKCVAIMTRDDWRVQRSGPFRPLEGTIAMLILFKKDMETAVCMRQNHSQTAGCYP